MATSGQTESASLSIENIGGIDAAEVSFTPGVTILAGRNATNRTSLLQAIMAACGSDDATIKGDASEASVELVLDGEVYTRSLTRVNGSVRSDGEPYLEDSTVADLFAFLLESNGARLAVARGEDLRELIMRPIDTNEIEEAITELQADRKRIEGEIDEIEGLKRKLPELESERTSLRQRRDELQSQLSEKEAEIESINVDVETSKAEQEELDETLQDLREKRSNLEEVRYELETERESIEHLQDECNELRSKLDDLPETPDEEVANLESQLERLRTRRNKLEAQIKEVQSTISFNKNALEDEAQGLVDALTDSQTAEGGPVTDQLVDGESVICWTCGTEVEQSHIESTLEQLRELSKQKIGDSNDLAAQIEEIESRRKSLVDQRHERERAEQRLASIEKKIEGREQRIDELQSKRDDLSNQIETLDEAVQSLEGTDYSELLSLHKEANELEHQLGRVESELERVEENISTIEARIQDLGELETKHEEVQAEIRELRGRIDRIEKEAVESFNNQMDEVLTKLHYDNLARVWLERVTRDVQEGKRTVSKSEFELHVVRKTDTGVTYRDSVEHLSESEREVVGLVFALAGYLVHEVHEQLPFMLLDSLEAIDAERIANLVDHVSEYSPYLVIALLEEDAQAIDENYDRIESVN